MKKLDASMEKLGNEGRIVTIGSGGIINKNSESYAQIIRPFD